MSYVVLPKNDDNDAALVENKARIKPDYSILSTDAFPSLGADDAGRILEYTDTGERFRWSGTTWFQTSPLPVITRNKISADETGNSSIIPLGISGVFTGTGEDISDYAAINVSVATDESSATDGLSFQWSPDNVNWDEVENHTITGTTSFNIQAMGEGHYFRIVYTNGTTAQTVFRLHTIYKIIPSLGEVQRLSVSTTDDSDAQLVRSVLSARIPAGTYINIDATTGGNLKFSLEEFDDAFQTNPLPVIDKVLSEEFDEEQYLSTYLLDTAAVDMAVDGTTPVTYKYTVPTGKIFYLKRGFLVIEDGASAFLPGNFGALGALTNGVSIGVTPSGGSRVEIENWKTNRQIRDTMFDFDQQFRTDGAYVGRWSFTKDANFAGIVLGVGDIFDFIIQDNLVGLDYLSFKLKGILKDV